MIKVKEQQNKGRQVTGFQSPAAEYTERSLDITDRLVVDFENTYYISMQSDDMADYGIFKGNILIIDRTLEVVNGAIVVFSFADKFYTRYYIKKGSLVYLQASSKMEIMQLESNEFILWGVVIANINRLIPKALMKGRYADVCTCGY